MTVQIVRSHEFKKYMCILFWVINIEIFNAWRWPVRPKHVAYIDGNNKICCVRMQSVYEFLIVTLRPRKEISCIFILRSSELNRKREAYCPLPVIKEGRVYVNLQVTPPFVCERYTSWNSVSSQIETVVTSTHCNECSIYILFYIR